MKKHFIAFMMPFLTLATGFAQEAAQDVSVKQDTKEIQSLQLLPRLWLIPQILPALLNPLFKMLLHDRSDPGTSKYKI